MRTIEKIGNSKWFDWLWNAWTIRGWSVFGVVLTLAFIAAIVGVGIVLPLAGLLCWRTGTLITFGAIAAVMVARNIWREAK